MQNLALKRIKCGDLEAAGTLLTDDTFQSPQVSMKVLCAHSKSVVGKNPLLM